MMIAYLFISMGGVALSSSDPKIDPTAQDEGCHRAALASAANNNPGFEWNGFGMDYYRDAYDPCLAINGVLGK
jgi:hypothetical protein